MNWVDEKYINLLSFKLRNFKRKQNHVYNFSCPVCLDSVKHKLRARGYVLSRKGSAYYHCHNCNLTLPLGKFIKVVDPAIYQDYILEALSEKRKAEAVPNKFAEGMQKPVFRKEGILVGLKTVSQLYSDDPVKQLVVSRKIPNKMHPLLFKCDKFMRFTNKILPDKFDEDALKHDSTRLLIPMFNKAKQCFAYQGRAIGNDTVRYITIVVDDSEPKVFGLERVDPNKKVFVFEGPMDAMFIDNSIATAGGDLVSTLTGLPIARDRFVICYDNERYSKETIAKINKAIEYGYEVCIFPDTFAYKDINEAILGGLTSAQIQFIIERNIFSDLAAKFRLSGYSKV